MSKLREAAQQALEALLDDCLVKVGPHSWERRSDLAITALRAALAEPVQEPVAWLYRDHNGQLRLNEIQPKPYFAFPVYTAPPQRKPLTDDQIADAANSVRWSAQYHVDFARAVERAHGIGGNDE